MTEWAYFAESSIRNFGPNQNTTSDLAPPRHISLVNDITKFIAYALRIGITSEQHQVSLFVNNHQHAF